MVNRTNIDKSGLYRVPKVSKVEDLTLELLKEHALYDPETGDFTILKSHSPVYKNRLPYKVPKPLSGYQKAMLLNKRWATHRLAVLWVTGKLPDSVVDHINGDVTDNRWRNLRVLSPGENVRNQKQTKRTSKSGVTGVYKRGRKFFAHIRIDKKLRNLGMHDSLEDAIAARTSALREFLESNGIYDPSAQCNRPQQPEQT